MKIISLNTWQGNQSAALKDYLQQHTVDTDMFLLQEANGETESLRSKVFKREQSITTRKYDIAYDEEYWVTSIFKSNFHLHSSGTFFVNNPEQGHGHWLEGDYGGEHYVICNIHGTPIPSDKNDTSIRTEQSKEILIFLNNRPGKHIIMGDFNLFPNTQSIALFEEAGYRNLIAEYKIDTTRNELAWARYPDNKQLFADYAFVSHDVKVVDFRVPKNEISDHLPLELIIA